MWLTAWLVVGSSVIRTAEGFDFTAAGNTPIEVLAEQGIEWQQDTKRLVARGNVQLSRGNVTVWADTLTAHYRERGDRATGPADVYRLQAMGNVRITSPTETASGDAADYSADDQLLVLRGRPARLETPTETLTAHDTIEYHEDRQVAMARGDVHVITQEGRTLRADTITADFPHGKRPLGEQKQKMKITHLAAAGNVRIETAEEVVRGEHGTYNTETGIATLTGSVKITRGDNQINGAHAVVNLKSGVSRLYAVAPGAERKTGTQGRVRLLVVPNRKHDRQDAGTDSTPGADRPVTP